MSRLDAARERVRYLSEMDWRARKQLGDAYNVFLDHWLSVLWEADER